MKTNFSIGLSLLIAIAASAQNPNLRGTLSQGFDDLGTIKVQAEQGDVVAQVKLADAYLLHNQSSDALNWYEAAAKQKSIEGEYEAGNLLLFGRFGIPKDQSISAKPTEGLKWTYLAAINGHQGAWRNMAKALQTGTGCSTNLIESYSWLNLLADTGDIVGRVEMNNLALKLSSDEILNGKSLAEEMKSGHWPQLDLTHSATSIVPLVLQGISGPKSNRLAIINNITFAENDTSAFKVNGQIVKVTCLKISDVGVMIKVEGEDEPRLLRQK
ncbi:MAG TPA: tetratricopeptide repeat protein [Verrucomicrobiae bacterium]|jgi:TPR repeat protein|nr:tetratricopeptide repeat protein [Verrucomicrobiae bacterium]